MNLKVCGMREALVNMVDLWTRYCAPRNVEFDSQVIEAKRALSSPPTCPHKEEAEKLREQLAVGEAGGRLLQAVQEKTQDQVAALQAEVEKLRQEKNFWYECPVCNFASNSPDDCPNDGHFVEQTTWKDQCFQLVAKRDTLQAALDEANGRIMEWEFRCQHFSKDTKRYCPACHSYPNLDNDYPDERHRWSRERWTEEAKAMREKG